jgi:hypothetical protein
MLSYRLYRVNGPGQIVASRTLRCRSDEKAIDAGIRMTNDGDQAGILSYDRFVAAIGAPLGGLGISLFYRGTSDPLFM